MAAKRAPTKKTTWKLPKGYTLTICGDVLQVCDAAGDEVLCIDEDDADEWIETMKDAADTQQR